MRMLHLHAWELQGPGKEPYKVTPKRKEAQLRMFQWSDKQQPVLRALEMHELMSCYMHHGIFPAWEKLSVGVCGYPGKAEEQTTSCSGGGNPGF